MATSIQDLIKQKKQEIDAKKGRARTWKPAKGKNKIRILPSWRGNNDPLFFHDFGQHFVKNSKDELEAIYLCVEKTFGKDCPVCQAIGHGIQNANDDDTVKLLKKANASQKYLMNVLVLSDPDEKKRLEPQIMEAGLTVFESICNIIDEYGDITSLTEGVDLVITREGSSQFDTKYTVMPSPKSVKVPSTVMANVHNLDEYVAQENEAAQNKALGAVGRAAGLLTAGEAVAGTAAALPSSRSAQMDDDMTSVYGGDEDEAPWGEASDAEIVNEDASLDDLTTTATSDDVAANVSDDDLDSLLAELS